MSTDAHYDVVIVGGGFAGLSLARHLLLESDKTVLVLERRDALPGERQKVGESSVQIGGYYMSKVLDLEEHLWRHHFMKYNLRFNWRTTGNDGSRYEDYSQATIRNLSNIPSYQIDRNVFEAEMLRLNSQNPRFSLRLGVSKIDFSLAEDPSEAHQVTIQDAQGPATLTADWLIDASGRVRLFSGRQRSRRPSTVRHGSFFWWVDGLVDVERLTDAPRSEIRKSKAKRQQGHLPTWLATQHFCVEGAWLWVIPLHGKTSLGLVFDKDVVDPKEVFSAEKATRWVCERFPCLARDLPHREVLETGAFRSFSYDCAQTLSEQRWAMTGESGRFSDPLYSPGNDLIAIHNTLIVDAILTDDPAALRNKCQRYEHLVRAVYQAYLPSYSVSYDALGDPETMSLKYTWELTVYFAGYVFPFINDLFTNQRFLVYFMRLFMRLGPINHAVQYLLSGYFQWKKETGRISLEHKIFFDFTELQPLAEAQTSFFEVGVSVEEAKEVLAHQMNNLEELARFIAVHIAAVVLGDERVLTSSRFIQSIDLHQLRFAPDEWRQVWEACADDTEASYPWRLDPAVMSRFHQCSTPDVRTSQPAELAAE